MKNVKISLKNTIVSALILGMMYGVISCDKNDNGNEKNPITPVAKGCNGSENLCDNTLKEISMVMTHNAFNHGERFLVPNQDFSVSRQLKDGVRGLMLDVYSSPNGPIVYHGFEQLGKEPLSVVFGEIYQFMAANPREVIVIIFQNACTDEELVDALKSAQLQQWVYEHKGTWPTLQEMIDSGQRLVCMLEVSDGNLPKELMYAWEYSFDTPYTFTKVSEFNADVNRGGGGKRDFYLINHWLSSALGTPDRTKASTANKKDNLLNRINDCERANGQIMNFLGVDFYNIGSALEVVNTLNKDR